MGGSITQIVYGEGRRQRAEVRGQRERMKNEETEGRGQRSEGG